MIIVLLNDMCYFIIKHTLAYQLHFKQRRFMKFMKKKSLKIFFFNTQNTKYVLCTNYLYPEEIF